MADVPISSRIRVRRLPAWLKLPVLVGIAIIAFWIIACLTIDLWPIFDPIDMVGRRLQPPSGDHWFGTDALGRDVLSRTLHGARLSLIMSCAVIVCAVLIGSTIGAIAGYMGGFVDGAAMRLVDITLSFPPILLAMAVTASLGPGLENAAVAMVIVWWPVYARLMRGQVLSIRSREHVEAATAAGAGHARTLVKHILPLSWSPILINATMDFGQVVLLTASLSFIGLGASPPTPEWGSMISEGAIHFYQWWICSGPGIAILSVVLGFNFLGDGLRDLLDPEVEMTAPLLEVSNLTISFGALEVVRDVNLSLADGKTLGLVGESGCGKSVTMLAIMGLLPDHVRVSGSIKLRGEELLGRPQSALTALRGKRMAMIFQDPMTSLNPVMTVGEQLGEAIAIHNRGMTRRDRQERALALLRLVAIPLPERRILQYPHELSGGMRQRVMIAIAMANDPELLIADEPTTALDVTVQAQIMELLQRLQAERRMGLMLISHDLGVVGDIADDVAIMYAGRICERGPVDAVFDFPHHPYTHGLLASLPQIDRTIDKLLAIPGSLPSLATRPEGCRFHPRCVHAQDICKQAEPELRPVASGAVAACHFAESAVAALRTKVTA